MVQQTTRVLAAVPPPCLRPFGVHCILSLDNLSRGDQRTPAGAKLQSPLLDRQASGKQKATPRKKESAKAPPPAPPEAESTARGDDGANFAPIFVSGRPKSAEKGVPLLVDDEIRVSKEGGADVQPNERPDPDSPPKDNMPKITTDHMF
ncbi:hypothetical protein Y032_0135g1941 [Ancylostoma ceylanicum]|uniref:Uncharacterized protein n=1 Tax=Ancylostoma ceylanicum TaxID=53326 RepID=A0A016T5Q4_9BILA|nr:hypothetical protein Y032_0135g1941 [Ancylostoma ceylanicum]